MYKNSMEFYQDVQIGKKNRQARANKLAAFKRQQPGYWKKQIVPLVVCGLLAATSAMIWYFVFKAWGII